MIILLLLALTNIACSDDPTSASLIYDHLETMSATDKMALNSSEIIFTDSIGEDIYTINFGKTDTFIEGKTFDVLIRYGTFSSCDEDLFIFNNNTSHWDQLGFRPDMYVCTGGFSKQKHLLSEISFHIENFIDSEGKVKVKYSLAYERISGRIFEVSADYF